MDSVATRTLRIAAWCSTLCCGAIRLLSMGHAIRGFEPSSSRILWSARLQRRNNLPVLAQVYFDDDPETQETVSTKLTAALERLPSSCENRPLSLFNTRLDTIQLNRTRLGPSMVVPGQRGLFASRDCAPGDLLTCYPGDLVILIPDEGDYSIMTGKHVVQDATQPYDDPDYDLSHELMGYLLHASEDHGVLGLPDLDDNPSYFGHFANDGAVQPTQADDVTAYVTQSLATANGKHVVLAECHMGTVATRRIVEGAEILVSYGVDYWMDHSDYE